MSGRSAAIAHGFCPVVDGPELKAPIERSHGGDVDRWAQSTGVQACDVLDFSASINPLGPPPSARRAFIASYGEISRYPDPYGMQLREALAERHNLRPEEIVLGNGSTQLIYLLCNALHVRKALIVSPAFSEYANAVTLGGGQILDLCCRAEGGFQFSLRNFLTAWDKDCNIAFLATPNSVSGELIPRADVELIALAALEKKRMIVVDEAFIDFVEHHSVKALVRDNPYLIVLRSLTKYFSLPGLRLGYLFGEKSRVEQIVAHQEPWSINTPAMAVALACLEDASFAAKTAAWLEKERQFLSQQLTALGLFSVHPSQANFLLIRIRRKEHDALHLRAFLAQRRILIRVCDSFAGVGAEYFRIAVKRRKDNERLLAALRQWSAANS